MNIEFVFGGSFDPLHKGHFNLVNELITFIIQIESEASSELFEKSFRFLPCAVPALKEKPLASFKERSEKLYLAFSQLFEKTNIRMLVDDREYLKAKNDGEKSYTIDSLIALDKENDKVIRFLIIGADNLIDIERWKSHEKLSLYCNLIVVNRPGYQLNDWYEIATRVGFTAELNNESILGKNERKEGRCYYFPIKEVDISSTKIKEKIDANKPVEQWLVV